MKTKQLLIILMMLIAVKVQSQNCTFNMAIDNVNSNASFVATDTLSSFTYIFIVDTTNVLSNNTGGHTANFQSSINDLDTHSVCLKIVDLINQTVICETCTTFVFTPGTPTCNITTQLTDNLVVLTLNNPVANATTTWDFGDGTSYFGTTVSHPYNALGTYNICVTSTDANGNVLCQSCTSIVVTNINANVNCNFYPTIVGNNLQLATNNIVPNANYTWIVSNTDTIVQATLDLNIANYQMQNIDSVLVTLVLTYSGYYCTSADWVQIPAPVLCAANFQSISNGLTAYFIDVTTNNNPVNSKYKWSFGDGDTSIIRNTQHTYAMTGTYNVCFYVRDTVANYLCNDTICQMVTVSNLPPIDTCASLFVFTQLQPYYIGIVNMVSGVNPQFSWDFGDGPNSILNGAYPQYTYAQTGDYNVCLTVTTDNCSDTFCDSLSVDSLGMLGKSLAQSFTVNVVSPQQLINPTLSLHKGDGTAKLKLFPNPANDKLFVESSKLIVISSKLIVTDILGNEIEVQSLKSKVQSDGSLNFELSIFNLKAGIYFVRCGEETIKFIKE